MLRPAGAPDQVTSSKSFSISRTDYGCHVLCPALGRRALGIMGTYLVRVEVESGEWRVDQKPRCEGWVGAEAGLPGAVRAVAGARSNPKDSHTEVQRLGRKEHEGMGVPQRSGLASLAGLRAGWNREAGTLGNGELTSLAFSSYKDKCPGYTSYRTPELFCSPRRCQTSPWV